MIDFSKKAEYDISISRVSENNDTKKTRNRNERNIHVDYDFAERDVETAQKADTMLGVKVPESMKTETPKEPAVKKFNKTTGFVKQTGKKDDFQLS